MFLTQAITQASIVDKATGHARDSILSSCRTWIKDGMPEMSEAIDSDAVLSKVSSSSFNNMFLLAGTITLVNEATAELARNQVSNVHLYFEGGNQYCLAAPLAQVVHAVNTSSSNCGTPADEHTHL